MRTLIFNTVLDREDNQIFAEVTAEVHQGFRATMIDPDEPPYADIVSVVSGSEELIDDLNSLQLEVLEERALALASETPDWTEQYEDR